MDFEYEWAKKKSLADGFLQKGNLAGAQGAYKDALSIAEGFGDNDRRLCWTVEALANVLQKLELYSQAEVYFERAFKIKEQVLGVSNLSVGYAADAVARVCYYSHSYDKAETYAKRCVETYESVLGTDHKDVATVLMNLAMLYHMQQKFNEAEPLYKRAMSIRTKLLGNEHPDTIKLLRYYADLLRATHREAEAEHLTSCATGLVTGSWKAIVLPEDEALNQQDACMFCGADLKGSNKCTSCGTMKGMAV